MSSQLQIEASAWPHRAVSMVKWLSRAARGQSQGAVEQRPVSWSDWCFGAVVMLWVSAGMVSLALWWLVPIPPSDEDSSSTGALASTLSVMADMLTYHDEVVERASNLAAGPEAGRTNEQLCEFQDLLTRNKQRIRAIAMAAVEDRWSRETLVTLRREMLQSYFDMQNDLDKALALPAKSDDRALAVEHLLERANGCTRQIAQALDELAIRPVELDHERAGRVSASGGPPLELRRGK